MTIPVSNRFGLLTGVRAHLTARNFERNILMTVISQSRYTYESGVKTLGTVVISRLDGVELILSTPAADRGLWEEFLHGAYESYCQHGAQAALDLSAVREGTSTSLFYALVEQGRVIGGVRAQGPYTCASQSHALVEWAGNAGYVQVRNAIAARILGGVVEMKSAWVSPNAPRPQQLADALARVALPTMELLHSRYVMATAADHVLARWESSGGRVDPSVPATAYPDSRYRTRIMWWDRRTLHADADPIVWRRMWAEHEALCRSSALGSAHAVRSQPPVFRNVSVELPLVS